MGRKASYTMIEGDCLEALAAMPPKVADCVICDPPYGVTGHGWDTPLPVAAMWHAFMRAVTNTGAVLLFATQPFASELVAAGRGCYKHEWVWVKNRPFGLYSRLHAPLTLHESVLVFSRAGAGVKSRWPDAMYYSPQRGGDGSYPVDVLRYPKDEPSLHPSQKPVGLLRYLVRTYCPPGGTVLDPCMGSGSTMVAAYLERRRFIGIERDPGFFGTAEERARDVMRRAGRPLKIEIKRLAETEKK